jgi:hypothetical protein
MQRGRRGREGLLTGGLLRGEQRMGESSSAGGRGPHAIGPQILVQGAKKLLQDVSGDCFERNVHVPAWC